MGNAFGLNMAEGRKTQPNIGFSLPTFIETLVCVTDR